MTRTKANAREEGATMIIVMIILLAVTALALFAVHTTTYELRAAGHNRTLMQADTVAESGLTAGMAWTDQNGPRELVELIDEGQTNSLVKPVMAPFEPELLADKGGYRMYSPDFANFTTNDPVHADAMGGTSTQPYDPFFTVDVNDAYKAPTTVAGHDASGGLQMINLLATYTARGRMRLRSGDVSLTDESREYHETAGSARAIGLTGPFPEP